MPSRHAAKAAMSLFTVAEQKQETALHPRHEAFRHGYTYQFRLVSPSVSLLSPFGYIPPSMVPSIASAVCSPRADSCPTDGESTELVVSVSGLAPRALEAYNTKQKRISILIFLMRFPCHN